MSRLLHETGEALYGPRWQSELARDLSVSIRQMQRWAAGSHDVPAGVWRDLRELAQHRAGRVHSVIVRLDEAEAAGAVRARGIGDAA